MRRVSEQQVPLKLVGFLFAWDPLSQQPAFVLLEGALFIALYSTPEKLAVGMKTHGEHCTTKQVLDQEEFLDSLRGSSVRIMVDPWVTEEGNTRFLEIPKP